MPNNEDFNRAIDEMSLSSNILFNVALKDDPDMAKYLVKDIFDYLGYKNFQVLSSKARESEEYGTFADLQLSLENGFVVPVRVLMSHSELPKRYLVSEDNFIPEEEDYEGLPPLVEITLSEQDIGGLGKPLKIEENLDNSIKGFLPLIKVSVYVNSETGPIEDEQLELFKESLFEDNFEEIEHPIAHRILESYKTEGEKRMYLEGVLRKVFEEEYKDLIEENNRLLNLEIENQKEIASLKDRLKKYEKVK